MQQKKVIPKGAKLYTFIRLDKGLTETDVVSLSLERAEKKFCRLQGLIWERISFTFTATQRRIYVINLDQNKYENTHIHSLLNQHLQKDALNETGIEGYIATGHIGINNHRHRALYSNKRMPGN